MTEVILQRRKDQISMAQSVSASFHIRIAECRVSGGLPVMLDRNARGKRLAGSISVERARDQDEGQAGMPGDKALFGCV